MKRSFRIISTALAFAAAFVVPGFARDATGLRYAEIPDGAYAVVAMIVGYGILGFRDKHGIRPLVYGRRKTRKGYEHMLASESVALDSADFTLVRDVAPGEAIWIDTEGKVETQQCADDARLTPCIFEHVYFARPDSLIDGVSVYKSRLRMGEKLAQKALRNARQICGLHKNKC